MPFLHFCANVSSDASGVDETQLKTGPCGPVTLPECCRWQAADVDYIVEKFDCIFGGRITATA